MSSRVVVIPNRSGRKLWGILDAPPGAAGIPVATVLLSPGLKTRVGPHRLYRKLAPAFLTRGMPVLRLDLEGFGDSEGEPGTERVEEIYRAVALGRHVADVVCALDWLENSLGMRRVIVGGLCGAAITGLHAAVRDRRIAALYAIGFPVILHSVQSTPSRGELHSKREIYLRKLFAPAAWLRLVSLKTDFALMLRVLRGFRAPSGADTHPDLNPDVATGLAALHAEGRPALLIFGERDRLRFDYEEKFARLHAATLASYGRQLEVAIVPQTNHVLGDPAAVAEALRVTGAWLDSQFMAITAAGPAPPWLGARPYSATA
jgi:pimeloyl-ACP methyl ester carboxylesterase